MSAVTLGPQLVPGRETLGSPAYSRPALLNFAAARAALALALHGRVGPPRRR
jgi:hypothetical protein